MLQTIAVILLVLWLLGLVRSTALGGFVHVLLAAADKRDTDDVVAVEKSDALAGDAKSGCFASAKTTCGKA